MDELLKALQEAMTLPNQGDEGSPTALLADQINGLACELFITDGGHINRAQVNEFEKYAPCKIFPVERDSFGWLVGGITYNGRTFTFG